MIAEDGGSLASILSSRSGHIKSNTCKKLPEYGSMGSGEFFSCVGSGFLGASINWRGWSKAALIGIQRHPDIVGQVSPRKVRCFLILPIGKRLAAGVLSYDPKTAPHLPADGKLQVTSLGSVKVESVS